MERILFFIDHLSQWTGKAFAWSMLILTFATSYEVFVRYVVRNPTAWAFDLSYIMYGAMFMMAGAYALSQKAHVRGDFLYRLLPPRVQAGIDLVLYFLFFFPGMIALVYAGYVYAAESWAYRPYGIDGLVGEVSINSPVGVPVSPLKTILPVAAFLLVLQGIAETIRCVQCLRTGAWPQRLKDVEELETQMIREHQEKLAAQKRKEELEAQNTARQGDEGNEGTK
jgi:TRAP-type mannitol/chloroaromatic compound transport system permease small subunit